MRIAAIFTLAACGGGKAGLQPSIAELGTHAYTGSAYARHSYTPYATRSHAFTFRVDGEEIVYIGGDLEPRENLRHIATENGIRYYMGAVRDGVGVNRLENYETDLEADGQFAPFRVQPRLYLNPDFLEPENFAALSALWSSVLTLNDALPPEFQIVVDVRDSARANAGEIVAVLRTRAGIASACGVGAVACAQGQTLGRYTNSATLYIPNDFDATEYTRPRAVIAHELLHALGIWGHVDSIEFPDSIMGGSGEYIPNLGHVLSRIDREVLQIMYMSQRSDLYNDWGEWSDTSFHIVGRTRDEKLHFGVALFNGLPQPWARGEMPNADLADNPRLLGTATWDGALLAFSGASPLAGEVELQVRLSTLDDPNNEQSLRFRDIYFLNRFESRGPERWFDTRNIDYKVNISGNGFQNVQKAGYEQGLVTGAFMGRQHEHMGGTVKRTDMVGAFGGSR